jgi:hypothetical protein
MDDLTSAWERTFRQLTERVELARRESDGVSVKLLWSRETDVLAVSVIDARGGNFELVLGPNEPPLDVFHHPYAYAAVRGLTTPRQLEAAPPDAPGPSAGQISAHCRRPVHVTSCDICRAHIRTEVASGLAKLVAYLDRWAQFDDWSRAVQSPAEPVRIRRKPAADDER